VSRTKSGPVKGAQEFRRKDKTQSEEKEGKDSGLTNGETELSMKTKLVDNGKQ